MIHQYQLGGYNIVLDTCSGSVHVVDEVAYEIIGLFEEKSREEILSLMAEKFAGREDIIEQDIAECYDQVVSLKDAGKLFAPDTFAPMAGKLKEKTAGVVKALCLVHSVLFAELPEGVCSLLVHPEVGLSDFSHDFLFPSAFF